MELNINTCNLSKHSTPRPMGFSFFERIKTDFPTELNSQQKTTHFEPICSFIFNFRWQTHSHGVPSKHLVIIIRAPLVAAALPAAAPSRVLLHFDRPSLCWQLECIALQSLQSDDVRVRVS